MISSLSMLRYSRNSFFFSSRTVASRSCFEDQLGIFVGEETVLESSGLGLQAFDVFGAFHGAVSFGVGVGAARLAAGGDYAMISAVRHWCQTAEMRRIRRVC